VKFGSGDRSGGFDYVVPESIASSEKKNDVNYTAEMIFADFMNASQEYYDMLRELGVPAEDARAVLPNAAATNLVMTANLRAILEFYAKRQPGKGAQKEISDFAEALKAEVINEEPWTAQFFDNKEAK
jgi:thymidylate synthase (FAD)